MAIKNREKEQLGDEAAQAGTNKVDDAPITNNTLIDTACDTMRR